jgi:hypothetical protein
MPDTIALKLSAHRERQDPQRELQGRGAAASAPQALGEP